jgi:surface protein
MSINDFNIKKYVDLYCSGQKQLLPPRLRRLPIGQWDVSKVTDMQDVFSYELSFNEPLNDWDVRNVTNMTSMFDNCIRFNQPLNKWNVSKVNNMDLMFYQCSAFDQDLSSWDVSNVNDYTKMFDKCPIQPSYKPDFNKKKKQVVSEEETKDYEEGDGMSTLGQNQTFGESEEKPVGGKKKRRRRTKKTRKTRKSRLSKKRRSKRRQ